MKAKNENKIRKFKKDRDNYSIKGLKKLKPNGDKNFRKAEKEILRDLY